MKCQEPGCDHDGGADGLCQPCYLSIDWTARHKAEAQARRAAYLAELNRPRPTESVDALWDSLGLRGPR